MEDSKNYLPGSASRTIPIHKTGSSSRVPDVHINIKNVDPDEISEVSVSEISQSVTHVVQIKRLNRPSSVYQPKISAKDLLDDESDVKKAESSDVGPSESAPSTSELPVEPESEGQAKQEVRLSNAVPGLELQKPPESAEVDHVVKESETFAITAIGIITACEGADDVITEEEVSEASIAVPVAVVNSALPPTSDNRKPRLEKRPSIASADEGSGASSQFDVSEIPLDLVDIKWEESRAYNLLPQHGTPLIAVSGPSQESVFNPEAENYTSKTLASPVERRKLKPVGEASIDEAIDNLIQSTQFDVDAKPAAADVDVVETVVMQSNKIPGFEIGSNEESSNLERAVAESMDDIIESALRDVVDGTPKLEDSTTTVATVIMSDAVPKVDDAQATAEGADKKTSVENIDVVIVSDEASVKPDEQKPLEEGDTISITHVAPQTAAAQAELENQPKSSETTVTTIFPTAVETTSTEANLKEVVSASFDKEAVAPANVKRSEVQPYVPLEDVDGSVLMAMTESEPVDANVTSKTSNDEPAGPSTESLSEMDLKEFVLLEAAATSEIPVDVSESIDVENLAAAEATKESKTAHHTAPFPVDTQPPTETENIPEKSDKPKQVEESQLPGTSSKVEENVEIPVTVEDVTDRQHRESAPEPSSTHFPVTSDELISESEYPPSDPDERPIIHQQSFEIPVIFEKKSTGEWPVTESEDEVSKVEHSEVAPLATAVSTAPTVSETAITVENVTSEQTVPETAKVELSDAKSLVTAVTTAPEACETAITVQNVTNDQQVNENAKVEPATVTKEVVSDATPLLEEAPDEIEIPVRYNDKDVLPEVPEVTLRELIAEVPIQFEYDTDASLDIDIDHEYSEAAKALSTIAEEHSEAVSPTTPDQDLIEEIHHVNEALAPIDEPVTDKTPVSTEKLAPQPSEAKPEDDDEPIEQVTTTSILQMAPLHKSRESSDLPELVRKRTASAEPEDVPVLHTEPAQQAHFRKSLTPEPSAPRRNASKDSSDTQSVTQTDDLTYVTVQAAPSDSEHRDRDRRQSTPTERGTLDLISSASDSFFDATEGLEKPPPRERTRSREKDLTPVAEVVTLRGGDIDVTVEDVVVDEEDYKPVIRLRKRESRNEPEERDETTPKPVPQASTSKVVEDENRKQSTTSIIKLRNDGDDNDASASQEQPADPDVNREPDVVVNRVKRQEAHPLQLLEDDSFEERYRTREEKLFRELAAHPASPIFDQPPPQRKTSEDIRRPDTLTETRKPATEHQSEPTQGVRTILLSPRKAHQEDRTRSPQNKSPVTADSIIRDLREVNLEITRAAVKSPSPSRSEDCFSPRTLTRINNLNVIWENGTEARNNGQPRNENEGGDVITHHPVFVKDTSKYWYKPTISREDAISMLREKPPGTFVVRDSNSFPGAFGLALKVAKPPEGVPLGDGNELVRHFLIEPSPKGVKLKGCNNEPVFGTLAALVYQHSITPMALPCRLLLPEYDPASTPEHLSAAQALLEQGAACNVTYIYSFDTESLTGPEAVRRAVADTFVQFNRGTVRAVNVHFKVSAQGITLTDNTRTLFFRRHYPVNSVIFAGIDPEDRKWDNNSVGQLPPTYVRQARIFGFVARKISSRADNACHVFAELDPEQPASAVVNFITKVMMGQNQTNRAKTPVA
uniref:SH2 domain-containing protein n=1 Tax=Panagrellus redivivus TaxID=6233 RepID=A0A7E4VYW3_PANRE